MTYRFGGDVGSARGWWAGAAIALTTLLIANRDLVLGRVTAIYDALNQFYPYYVLVADFANGGEFLLWNPWMNGGAPEGFEQTGAFSPLTLGLAWLTGPSEAGFRVYWLTLWALGGLGALLLARHLGGPSWSGCLAAIGWMFCGNFVSQAQMTPFFHSMVFLPWIIWRFDAALACRRRSAAVQAGALWGLSALGGYPGLTIMTALYVLLWGAGRLLCSPRPGGATGPARRPREVGRLLLAAMAFVVVGTVVCAPTYLGFLVESRGYTERSGPLDRVTAVQQNALNPYATATLASPYLVTIKHADFLGSFDGSDGSLWGYTDPTTSSLYIAPALLTLAVLAPWLAPRDRFRWFLWGLGLFYLAAAMGRALPVRGWLYDLLPPTRYLKQTSFIREYFPFTVVALVPLACRELAGGPWPRARAGWRALVGLALIGTALAAAALAATYAVTGFPYLPKQLLLHFAIAWPGVAFAAAAGWLGGEALARRAVPTMLIGVVVLDAILTVNLSQNIMFTRDPELVRRLEGAHSSDLDLTGRGLDRSFGFEAIAGLNDHLIAKEPTLFGYSAMENRFHRKMVGIPALSRSALGADRIWFSPVATEVTWTDDQFDRLASESRTHGRPCLFVTDPDTLRDAVPTADDGPSPTATAAEPVPVEVRSYRPTELVIDVICPEAGWLMVTDRWAPGWRARVNGEPRKLWIGNFIFRAVRVEEGANRVAFSYHPFGFPWLLIVSWLTLALVVLHAAWTGVARRLARRRSAAGVVLQS